MVIKNDKSTVLNMKNKCFPGEWNYECESNLFTALPSVRLVAGERTVFQT